MDAERSDALARRLDDLLSLRLAQRANMAPMTSIAGADPTMARDLQPLLVAAGRLDTLRDARPSDSYAAALETRLLRYAQSIQSQNDQALMGGAASLAGHDAPTVPIHSAPHVRRDAPAWPAPESSRRPLRSAMKAGTQRLPRVAWVATLAAAVLLAMTVGVFTVAASAAPGSPLYGVRRLEQTIQSQLTTDAAARVRLHLANATDALNALDAAATRHDAAAYEAAISTLQSEDAAAQSSLAQVTSNGDHATLQGQLDALHTREQHDLSANLPLLNWPEQVQTTTALGGLGIAAPTVTSVQITPPGVTQSGGHGEGSQNGTGGSSDSGGQPGDGHGWLVTAHGAGFTPGARLVVDGKVMGQTLSVTSTTLIAVVDEQDGGALAHASQIGVSLPNGEAAETSTITHSAPDATPYPTTTPTATPHGDHHKGGH